MDTNKMSIEKVEEELRDEFTRSCDDDDMHDLFDALIARVRADERAKVIAELNA